MNAVAGIIDPFTGLELLIALTIGSMALAAPQTGRAVFARLETAYIRAAISPRNQILAIGLLAILARLLFLPWLGPPVPVGFDEHSHVLQAQTYLAGRLVNPTPPFWEHFESIHINLVPAYASMYFPGRSLPLLVGLALTGHPWPGVVLSFALMCMAAVWMLQGWVRAPYAFLGGLLIVLRLGIFSYWVNSYWGGAFTALGGMLVLGALPRILQSPDWRSGSLMALGAAILLVTRPYEGGLLCAPVGVVILVSMLRRKGYPVAALLLKVGLPVAFLASLGAGWTLAYNAASTGDALTTPYELNRHTYAVTPAFLTSERFESAQRGPPHFREFYLHEDHQYTRRDSLFRLLGGVLAKAFYNWNFYIGFLLTPALVAGFWASRRDWALLAPLAVFSAGYTLPTWNYPHYTAPIFSVLLIILMKGFEWLRAWHRRGRGTGPFLVRTVPAGIGLALLLPAAVVATGTPLLQGNPSGRPCCALQQSTARSEIADRLHAIPGPDIVLVATDARHPPTHEALVFNEPDIERAEIVWAHRLGPSQTEALLRHYDMRRVWELEWGEDGNYRLIPRPEKFGSPAPR